MIRRLLMIAVCCVAFAAVNQVSTVNAQAFGATWGQQGQTNMDRFYHYPYVTYPQNYRGSSYYRSGNDMYHRYPAEMRIPVYNKKWYNYYPTARRYHAGHQFLTDIF